LIEEALTLDNVVIADVVGLTFGTFRVGVVRRFWTGVVADGGIAIL
jgi:hypothetical protein